MQCSAPAPSREGFLRFLRRYVGIPEAVLPDNSPQIDEALCGAHQWVDNGMWGCSPSIVYNTTLYNMGASLLLNYGYDESDYEGEDWFVMQRQAFGLDCFTPGVIESAADQGTSGSLAISDAVKNLSLAELQMLKDPYGMRALAVLQEMASVWTLTL